MTSAKWRGFPRRGGSLDRPCVVLIHRYFSPDTPPYATILRHIAVGLAEYGMDVEVLTCQPSYNTAVVGHAPAREQIAEHVRVTRWPVLPDRSSRAPKILNLIMFALRVVGRLATMPRVDAVMAASTPPVMIALVASFMAKIRNARFVYHKQDIYPEVAEAAGELPEAAKKVLRKLDTGTDRRADRVVVLSGDMARTITARGIGRPAVVVINNFDPWILAGDSTPVEHAPAEGIIRFVYAGNLGRFQNLEAVADVLATLNGDRRFHFDFIGDGPLRPWLESFVAKRNLQQVQIRGYVAPDVLAQKLRNHYDVGIVSLSPHVIRCAYPSKVMSYIRNGLPVLALLEGDTELVDVLTRYKAGWAADPADGGAVRRTLEGVWDDRDRLAMMRSEARHMYQTEFGKEGQILRWVQLFGNLVRSP